DESQITGEATPIAKTTGDSVVSGSFLVSGQAVVRATHVGAKSFINTMSGEVQSGESTNSQLLNTINRIIKILTVVIVPLGTVLFISRLLNHSSINQAILGTTAAMIGMIPEGLVLLTSVSLAVSAMNLARHRVLVRELPAIEGLARVDVLGLDKTGTITSGKLQLSKIVPWHQQSLDQVKLIIGGTINAIGDDNETARALNSDLTNPEWQPTKVVPFSSARKWSGVSVQQGNYVIGAPEFVLKQVPANLAKQIEGYAAEGYRVLCIAQTTEMNADDLGNVTVLGLILIEDEIRENAVETFRYFQNQDVALKVISGDNPTTVANIASRAGIKNWAQLIDMSSLEGDIDYDQLVAKYTVFGRVTPTQKKQLVKAWQRAGHSVAMTGDGVNDILALRQADCG
ncbi:MAG TPA: magnesium-transporting ATPase, partial [Lactobacillus sp.]|nr:magnesium-transporting ATPase [Lactobacillus sp.]